jgi:hypothetical protein
MRRQPGEKIAYGAGGSDTDQETQGPIDRVHFCTLKDTNAPAEQDQKRCDGPEFYALQQGKEALFRHVVPLLPALKNLRDDSAKGAEKKREKHP